MTSPSTFLGILVLQAWAAWTRWLSTERVVETRLTLQRAAIRLDGTGVSRTIQATDVRSTTTALNKNGLYDIAFELREKWDPLVIRDLSEPEFFAVKEALGLLQHGEGSLLWRNPSRIAWMSWSFATLLSLLLWIGARSANEASTVLLQTFLPWLVAAFVITTISMRNSIRISAQGVELRGTGKKTQTLLWSEIQSVSSNGNALEFRIPNAIASLRLPLSPAILEAIATQVAAAIHRARGALLEGDAGSLAALHRRKNESVSEWIARIDGIEVGDHSYRRAASLPLEALRAAVEDPNLPSDIRGAAARILLRTDRSYGERIELAFVRVHDPDVREELGLLSKGDARSIERHQSRARRGPRG